MSKGVYKRFKPLHNRARCPYIEALQQYSMTKQQEQLSELLGMISQLCFKGQDLIKQSQAHSPQGYWDYSGDLQKAIVSIIRGSEMAFKDLTGVDYHIEDTIPN